MVGAALMPINVASAQQSASAATDLEEVIVTARKRSEAIQQVPVSVSVLSGGKIEQLHATQLADYAGYIPGLDLIGRGSAGTNVVFMRGVFSGSLTAGAATVGTYIGDTPVSSSSPFGGAFGSVDLFPYDLERLEVLRGPQGTLYGSSAMGGLLKYVLKSPNLNEFEGRVGMEGFDVAGGNGVGWGARAGVNIPLIEGKVAVRASYSHVDNPGFIDNASTGRSNENSGDQSAGRIQLLWAPSDDLSITLTAVRETSDYNGNDAVTVNRPSLQLTFGDLQKFHNTPEPASIETGYYAATINWDLKFADLVSATSYSSAENETATDGSAFFLPVFGVNASFINSSDIDKWTQELRLISPIDEHVEWILGGFYTDEDATNSIVGVPLDPTTGDVFQPFNPLLSSVSPFTYEEYAAFGELTFHLTDAFDLAAGLRWSANKQTQEQNNGGFLFNPADPSATTQTLGDSSEDVLTYMGSARYKLSSDVMFYARIATGYRAGGPNLALPGVPASFDSDEVTNYEIGLKSQFLDKRALLDLTLFYIDWSNVQVLVQPEILTYTDNAGSATSQGLELTSAISPIDGLTFGLNAAYTDAKLTSTVPTLLAQDGDRIPRIPEWSASFTADYEFPIGADLVGRFGGGYRYVGERNASFESNPANFRFPSRSLVDLNASLAGKRWTARLYARNLTDEHAYLDQGNTGPTTMQLQISRPRMIGLSLDVAF
jgi:outer membrane receptor protein involved in Fe transport